MAAHAGAMTCPGRPPVCSVVVIPSCARVITLRCESRQCVIGFTPHRFLVQIQLSLSETRARTSIMPGSSGPEQSASGLSAESFQSTYEGQQPDGLCLSHALHLHLLVRTENTDVPQGWEMDLLRAEGSHAFRRPKQKAMPPSGN